ncbi:MAG: DUF2628 domain-containing protein [Proteobacteria bacterium]|nr:DUF2628 domain-containing protein [Pseudomonadota bacterium]
MGVRLYTVHLSPFATGPDRGAIFVREGFSWAAGLFGFLWALYHRLWWPALGMLAYVLALAAAEELLELDPVRVFCLDAAFALIVGFEANDMRRRALEARGYVESGVAGGADLDEAELRWFAAHT